MAGCSLDDTSAFISILSTREAPTQHRSLTGNPRGICPPVVEHEQEERAFQCLASMQLVRGRLGSVGMILSEAYLDGLEGSSSCQPSWGGGRPLFEASPVASHTSLLL